MFRANSVPRSNDPTLKKGERRFYGIGVNVSHDVNVAAVVDGFMRDACDLGGMGIRRKIVGNDHVNIGFDVLSNVLRERSGLHVIGMKESQIAVALANPDHDFFVVVLGGMTFTDGATPDVGLVHFNRAGEFSFGRLFHRSADSVAEIPSGLVGDAESTLNLASRDALLCFTEKQCSHEPLFERQMGVVKDRASGHGKLVVTALAVEKLFVSLKLYSRVIAARALRSIVPAETAEQFAALLDVP